MSYSKRSPVDRFMEKFVVVDSGCWIWTGMPNHGGYGTFMFSSDKFGKKMVLAHRMSYETFVGCIPDGLVLDHLCRTPACVNWRHLEPVTRRINSLRGLTNACSVNAKKTHCKRGHEFNDANTRRLITRSGYGGRVCRVCIRQYDRALRARRRLEVESA